MDLEAVRRRSCQNEQDASAIIGKFGVGFYSAFMVASKVTVESKSYSDAVNAVWSSADGAESYTLQEGGSKTTRGTRVVLDLKEDAEEYLQPAKIARGGAKILFICELPDRNRRRAREHDGRGLGPGPPRSRREDVRIVL